MKPISRETAEKALVFGAHWMDETVADYCHDYLKALDCIDEIRKVELCDHWCLACDYQSEGPKVFDAIRKFDKGEE